MSDRREVKLFAYKRGWSVFLEPKRLINLDKLKKPVVDFCKLFKVFRLIFQLPVCILVVEIAKSYNLITNEKPERPATVKYID